MIARKTLLLKSIAVFLLLSFVTEVIFPTAAWALTSGPTTPDVYGNQPVDATDNVSLVTGDFNYTIPITSIPEYPMAVGYSSTNLGMDMEAGAFGFGVNAFTGAIARNLQGLPDDLNKGPRRYKSENQKMWDAAVTGSVGTSIPNTPINAGASLLVGYNNYTGLYGGIGIGMSSSIPVPGVAASMNMGFSVSSFSEASLNTGLSLSVASFSLSVTGQAGGNPNINFSNSFVSAVKNLLKPQVTSGIGQFPTYSGTMSSSLPPLANVIPLFKSNDFITPSIGFTLPITPPTSLSLSGRYKTIDMGNEDNLKNAYGFMYLNQYDNNERTHIADMTVEGEFSYNNVEGKDFRNSPVYLQRDAFTMNSQGMSGTMQLYQEEYGDVSRNYNRYQERLIDKIGFFITERKEVQPWTKSSRAVLNKSIDILKLLKSSDDGSTDFDQTLFTESTLQDLRTNDRKFNTEAKFKMRGDLAGEFNLSSSSSSDYQPNKYELLHLSGTGGDPRTFYMGQEKDMPLYYPNPVKSTRDNYQNTNNKILTSTNITSYKVGTVLSLLSDKVNYDPETDGDCIAAQKFKESFLNHYEIKSGSYPSKGNPVELKEGIHTGNFNIIKHIQELKIAAGNVNSDNAYFNDLIADIRVKNAEGLTYVYNLPVFCKGSKTLSLAGKGGNAPVRKYTGPDYSSFKADLEPGQVLDGDPFYKDRNKTGVTEEYYYPYAWLLTAVVGSDYIDFDDIPGPSDGDLGYWIKFRYVKTADNYKWRAPFAGLDHYPGALHSYNDDVYAVSSGLKEVYQVSEIESSKYTSKYIYHQRLDGVDAAGGSDFRNSYNGDAKNSLNQNSTINASNLGSNTQYVCTKIQLYKKHIKGDNSAKQVISSIRGQLLRETKFWYDYSLCPNVHNNYSRYTSIMQSNVPYHIGTSSSIHAGTGKLTLQKVQHISYESGSAVTLPSYELQYKHEELGSIDEANPSYDKNQVDQWGNYSSFSKNKVTNIAIEDAQSLHPGTIHFYHNYHEIDKVQADKNAQAFKLSKVYLPSGGVMSVSYEANSYGKVQDKTPYSMRHILKDIIPNSTSKQLKIKVDITDLHRDGKDLSAIINPSDNKSNGVYGELAFYESFTSAYPSREDQIYVSEEDSRVIALGAVSFEPLSNRWYQEVTLKNDNDNIPFLDKYKEYLYGGSNKMRAVKENFANEAAPCYLEPFLSKYENMELDKPINVILKMASNTKYYFTGDFVFKQRFKNCFGDPDENLNKILYSHKSFLRTPIYKSKYTGSKVKSITFTDNFQYATNPSGTGTIAHDNSYTTNYFADDKGDGTGNSMGVASIEPIGSQSAVIDIYDKKGAGFMPGPSILYSKSIMEVGYTATPSAPTIGDKISRKKGKTEYYFYTAADNDYKFDNNFTMDKRIQRGGNGRFVMFGLFSYIYIKFKFIKKITIRLPVTIPIKLLWQRADMYNLQAYSYLDQTDMFGKLKRVVTKDANNQEVSSLNYNYFGKDEVIQTYDGSAGDPEIDPFLTSSLKKQIRPGKMDQAWSEAYYTKETSIQSVPWILFLNAQTVRNFSYTNMKYTYLPSVLKEVVTTNKLDGSISKAQYTGFDYYTGQPLEVMNFDSYNNTKIQRIVPAYWKYAEMGPASLNAEKQNLLTQTTGSYQYLNTVSNNTLLDVGIVEYSKSNWQMVQGIRTKGKNYQPGCANFNYDYELMTSNSLEKLYNANEQTRNASPVYDKYVKDAKFLYRPTKTYAYKTVPASDGTFSITNFNYSGAQTDAKWTLLSTVTKYDLDGNTVETKDILDKYASAYFGYHFAHNVATASNASYNTAAYSGAENTYSTAGGVVLDDSRITLVDANVIEECPKSFIDKTMVYNDFTSGSGARLLTVCVPTNPTLNTPFAKADIVYAHNTSIKRSLYLSMDDNKEFRIMSDRGEVFKGFYVTPTTNLSGCMVTYKLGFDPSIFQSFTLDNTFTNSGYTVTTSTGTLPVCALPNKPYQIPATECSGIAHTGKYAFGLKSGGTGARFEIITASLPVSERNRKYKAMVWVHNSSPSQTTLLAKRVLSSGNVTVKTATLANPYVTIGEWSLLRIDVDPADYAGSDGVVFAVQNPTSGTAIFDDFRVLPYQASMTNSVYDHFTGRVTATLNGENFATFYKYDSKGRLIEVKAEIENVGKQTIKKYLYNEQKNN